MYHLTDKSCLWDIKVANLLLIIKCNSVFKNGPSKICGRQPLKNFKWYSRLCLEFCQDLIIFTKNQWCQITNIMKASCFELKKSSFNCKSESGLPAICSNTTADTISIALLLRCIARNREKTTTKKDNFIIEKPLWLHRSEGRAGHEHLKVNSFEQWTPISVIHVPKTLLVAHWIFFTKNCIL